MSNQNSPALPETYQERRNTVRVRLSGRCRVGSQGIIVRFRNRCPWSGHANDGTTSTSNSHWHHRWPGRFDAPIWLPYDPLVFDRQLRFDATRLRLSIYGPRSFCRRHWHSPSDHWFLLWAVNVGAFSAYTPTGQQKWISSRSTRRTYDYAFIFVTLSAEAGIHN